MGDIHGAYKALIQCLDRSSFDKENDTLIQIGDIADGWSEVAECVTELMTIKNLIAIRGNHDVWLWNWLTYGDSPTIWEQQGGKASKASYIRTGAIADKEHKNFFDNQLDYYVDEKNRLFVHGGFDLPDGFEATKQSRINIRRGSMLHWSRDLAELRFPDSDIIDKIHAFNEIFIGHTAHDNNHFNNYNIWNLDTGAGWSGVLTIMDVDTKEFFQSDNVQLLYPDEKGRR